MRLVDRLLQRWRGRVARSWIGPGTRVLDIGCHQGEFLQSLGKHLGPSVGLDPLAATEAQQPHRLLAERFPPAVPFAAGSFDVVVLLATLEHLRDKDPIVGECYRVLSPGGRVIVTVPSPWVDGLVTLLRRLRLADGMCLDEHHGYDPRQTPTLFTRHGFALEHRQRFQLGLNHLFVFRKAAAAPDAPDKTAPESRRSEQCTATGAQPGGRQVG